MKKGKGKLFEGIYLSVGMILIAALLIVLYQVNVNGRNKAIIIQNEMQEQSEEVPSTNQASNNRGKENPIIINLNTGTLEELQTLKGIGPSKAKAIIEYRSTVGQFQDIHEITNVSGIGEKTFENIKAYITIGKE